MITIYNNPFLMDFVRVAIELPQDEQNQVEALTGQTYDVDAVAIGAYEARGLKWVAKLDDKPIAIGGFIPERPGVWRDFMMTTPAAWEKGNAFRITLACRRVMDSMFQSGQAHRIECIAPAFRVDSRPELEKWYKIMRYEREAILRGYCAEGYDAVLFSRVGG